MVIVHCCWKRWWTRRVFAGPATVLPTGSISDEPPDAVVWTGSTKLTVKPSKTSTFIRWSTTPGSGYAAISRGKQILSGAFLEFEPGHPQLSSPRILIGVRFLHEQNAAPFRSAGGDLNTYILIGLVIQKPAARRVHSRNWIGRTHVPNREWQLFELFDERNVGVSRTGLADLETGVSYLDLRGATFIG